MPAPQPSLSRSARPHRRLQDGFDYAVSVGATYVETSAKLGRGIDEVFSGMGKRLLQAKGRGGSQAGPAMSNRAASSMLVDDPLPSSSRSSGCC